MSVSPEARGFLLNEVGGWQALHVTDTVATSGVLRLRPVPGSGRPLTDGTGTFADLADATGLAVDGDGNIYVLDSVTPALWRFDVCDPVWARVPCIAGAGTERRQVLRPNGIAITPGGDLIVADTGNRRIQVFSLKGWVLRSVWGPYMVADAVSPPRSITLSAEESAPAGTWLPWDVAVRPDGTVLVTDRDNGLVHRFDHRGAWLDATDGSADGFGPLAGPTHLAVDSAGNAYVVQDGIPTVVVLDPDGVPIERLETHLEAEDRFGPTAVAVDADGNVYVTDRESGALRQYGTPGPGQPRRPVVVCCLEGPCGKPIAVTLDGDPVVVSGLPRIEVIERQVALEREGSILSGPFDSEQLACSWHRVQLRADVPLGTFLQVHTYTSDSKKRVDEIKALPTGAWDTGVVHDDPSTSEWDCLVRGGRGRYLWLRLTLVGEGSRTPVVQRARVTCPRASTVRFLPGIFQQDPEGAEFLDRFVSVFDRVLDDVADHIGDFPRYLDPMVTPVAEGRDFLEWLASWIGLTLDRHWPMARRRALLAEAVTLYGARGTLAGIRRVLELYLGHGGVRILEHYRMRKWLHVGFGRLGERSELWGKEIVDRLQLEENSDLGSFRLVDTGDPLRDPFHVHAHQFTVFVPNQGGDDIRRHAIERIIATAKPAHTRGELRLVEPKFRVGHALVGMDTVVATYPSGVVAGETELGYDSVLGASDVDSTAPTMEIGTRRVGWDTVID